SLRHQARLQTHLRIAHIAFEFGFGDESGDRVDDNDIDATGTNQGLSDFEGLFAIVGLRDEEIVDVDAEFSGVGRIERVFSVNECSRAADLLGFGDYVQSESGLAAGFRAVNFDDASTRQAANAESRVNGN